MFKTKKYLKSYYRKNRKRILARSRRNYRKNRIKISLRTKAWNRSPHGKATRLVKKFNISYEEAKKWLKIKRCQICGDDLAVATDHDHKTGKVRGRLCFRCNRAMGAFHDSIRILTKAVEYLKRTHGR